MRRMPLVEGESLSVDDLRCSAGPGDRPYAEMHERYSLSYVRRGSFGCRTEGREYELVPGAVMVGRPGREYMATHEHEGCGDECLSVKLSAAFADSFAKSGCLWAAVRVPPLPELMVLGELVQAAADGRASVGVDEAAVLLVARFAKVSCGKSDCVDASPKERRRAVAAALWLEENAAAPVSLEDGARRAGLSPYHFLRLFSRVVGVTPHQYLLRVRLRRAAKLLAEETLPVTEVALDCGFSDLSNFVRTFGRAAGVSPKRFRRAARSSTPSERKILQERLAPAL
jgi:AraC-like DNA-binding protein